jgi:hypothetical protein
MKFFLLLCVTSSGYAGFPVHYQFFDFLRVLCASVLNPTVTEEFDVNSVVKTSNSSRIKGFA